MVDEQNSQNSDPSGETESTAVSVSKRRDLRQKFLRLFLRMMPVPFLPGPELYDLVQSFTRTEKDLDREIDDAIQALQKSGTLIENIESRLEERTKKLRDLQNEYTQYKELSKVTQEQAKAFSFHLEKVLVRKRGGERMFAFFLSIASGIVVFVLGVIFSTDIQRVISWIAGLVGAGGPTPP
ncbi:MAG: hypothetical protein IIA00_06560 [Proteobacteria bacterium]|nr:hypothetical protein [Pseudomonadota bacterium]